MRNLIKEEITNQIRQLITKRLSGIKTFSRTERGEFEVRNVLTVKILDQPVFTFDSKSRTDTMKIDFLYVSGTCITQKGEKGIKLETVRNYLLRAFYFYVSDLLRNYFGYKTVVNWRQGFHKGQFTIEIFFKK